MINRIKELEERASRCLINTDVLTSDVLTDAIRDTEQIVNNKQIPDYAYYDIALFRLKILLKIAVTETDYQLYRDAIKLLKETTSALNNEKNIEYIAIKNQRLQCL